MVKLIVSFLVVSFGVLNASAVVAADSYRFLHVSIDTPWMIFIFLLVIIMFPFVLMAVLYWYFAFKKDSDEKNDGQSAESTEEKSARSDGD